MTDAEVVEEAYEGEAYCWRCGGAGYIIVCMDDLCRNSDHCMHGDGHEPCPNCAENLP